MTGFPTMRAAFRTTVSGGGKYEMVFRFPSMDDLHVADDEWRTALATPASDVAPVFQFRRAGCGDWYDGFPDHGDGRGPYEERTLYAHPQSVDPVAGEALRELARAIDLARTTDQSDHWVRVTKLTDAALKGPAA